MSQVVLERLMEIQGRMYEAPASPPKYPSRGVLIYPALVLEVCSKRREVRLEIYQGPGRATTLL